MRNWNSYYAEQDKKEQERIRRQHSNMIQRQVSRSAPSQRATLSSLFTNPFTPHPGSEVRRPAFMPVSGNPELRLERRLEEVAGQVGLLSDVIHQINGDVRLNQEVNLDRLDGLRAQITRENEKLSRIIRSVRQRSNCDLRNPTTYIYCIELIYKLIFKIFVFLCQLVFVVGNSMKGFLNHMPFPFSLLVFIAYLIEMLLIFLIFDGTMFVSTAGFSHRPFIPHNALYTRYSGAPEIISMRGALYEGFVVSIMTVSSQIFSLLGEIYQLFLGDTMRMVSGVGGRYVSRDSVVQGVKQHVVEPVLNKAAEEASKLANEVASDQLSKMGSIPGKIGEFALEGAGVIKEGAGRVAGVVGEGAGRIAGAVGEGLAQRAERWSKLDSENVKESAQAALRTAKNASNKVYHELRRFGSRYSGGSTRKNSGSKQSGTRLISKTGSTLKNKDVVFSILTQNEQKEFDKTIAGRKIKQLGKIIDNIDYSKIEPNPQNFIMIRVVLNIAEKLFPLFVKELDRTSKVCKIMKRDGVELISNSLFLKKLGDIISH
jgi:hypothetical protein